MSAYVFADAGEQPGGGGSPLRVPWGVPWPVPAVPMEEHGTLWSCLRARREPPEGTWTVACALCGRSEWIPAALGTTVEFPAWSPSKWACDRRAMQPPIQPTRPAALVTARIPHPPPSPHFALVPQRCPPWPRHTLAPAYPSPRA